MLSIQLTVSLAAALLLGLQASAAQARDAAQPQAARPAQSPPAARVIPNPYAPAPAASDRAGDAYATGFAIGLGTALINKQHEDERKRQQEQAGARR